MGVANANSTPVTKKEPDRNVAVSDLGARIGLWRRVPIWTIKLKSRLVNFPALNQNARYCYRNAVDISLAFLRDVRLVKGKLSNSKL